MRVRASPDPTSGWARRYDEWNGQGWVQSTNPVNGRHVEQDQRSAPPSPSPPTPTRSPSWPTGTEDIQTFYLADDGPNLIFHADNVQRVYLQSRAV